MSGKRKAKAPRGDRPQIEFGGWDAEAQRIVGRDEEGRLVVIASRFSPDAIGKAKVPRQAHGMVEGTGSTGVAHVHVPAPQESQG